MTFEKALEAMRNGHEIRRHDWCESVCGIDNVGDIKRIYICNRNNSEECYRSDCHFYYDDLIADDWEIYEPKFKDMWFVKETAENRLLAKKITENMLKSITIEPGEFLNRSTCDIDKASKEQIDDALKMGLISVEDYLKMLNKHKEESTMYSTIEITFKSGNTISYGKDEWDDYSYDGTAISVKKDGACVGIYNFENVFSVELKK